MKKMNKSKLLQEASDNWQTNMGAMFPGERVVVRGKDLFADLYGMSWMGLLLYYITGREFSINELKVLDQLWMLSINYPDPRIWNNRIAALGGTTRSTPALSIGTAICVSEANIYGGQANVAAIDFIKDAKSKLDKGLSLDEIIKTELKEFRVIKGYGRPIASKDERIEPVLKMLQEHGYADGAHVKLALQVHNYLKESRFRMQINITGLAAAVGADVGFSAKEYYTWTVVGFAGGITACYLDSLNHEQGSLFPLSCDRVCYEGERERSWD